MGVPLQASEPSLMRSTPPQEQAISPGSTNKAVRAIVLESAIP